MSGSMSGSRFRGTGPSIHEGIKEKDTSYLVAAVLHIIVVLLCSKRKVEHIISTRGTFLGRFLF
jgi:hypothetical protein